jgi:lactoylglutathione lyase
VSLIHTCYRITDIDRSVAFYNALGFKEIGRLPIRDEAINVFMNMPDDGDQPRLELTYNVGRDEPYDIGTGYGHIAITEHDLDVTLARLAELGIEPEKPPTRFARVARDCASSEILTGRVQSTTDSSAHAQGAVTRPSPA